MTDGYTFLIGHMNTASQDQPHQQRAGKPSEP